MLKKKSDYVQAYVTKKYLLGLEKPKLINVVSTTIPKSRVEYLGSSNLGTALTLKIIMQHFSRAHSEHQFLD